VVLNELLEAAFHGLVETISFFALRFSKPLDQSLIMRFGAVSNFQPWRQTQTQGGVETTKNMIKVGEMHVSG
jgi:hypothetical protein